MPAQPPQTLEVQSVADQVYSVLRERIADGEIERGSRLHQEDLAAEFGISRTPVREALRKLAAEGLVDLFANRGARVATANRDQIRGSYEARLVVEPGAARLAARRRPSEPLKRMRQAIRDEERAGTSPERHFKANRDFHLALVQATENAQVVGFMEQVWIGRIGATLYEEQVDPDGLQADHGAHLSIAEAIEAGDGELAEELTRGHLERSMALLFEAAGD
ncbi:GntR family transcriptional regulator [Thermoleophilia bacterium SCSIO 60948]|nr:GntR family transcriptional regulator [Thermoleophilia bacterium SCSIO 60948]